LAYVTGLVNQELLQNEYLAAESRIFKTRLQPGWRLCDAARATLAEIGRRLGRQGLQPVTPARPDSMLAWYRQLVAKKFHGCQQRRPAGRPRTNPEIEDLVVGWARENSVWGYTWTFSPATDSFTVEVLTWRGLVTYYVLFFISSGQPEGLHRWHHGSSDRMVGALANPGHPVSDQIVGHILRRQGIATVQERSQMTSWKDLIRRHMDVLAGTVR
jgi:hypothetical protein